MANPLTGPLLAYASQLRFPTLFKITLGVFLLDLLIPDFIPFADEILLGLGALILSNWRKPAPDGTVIDMEQKLPPPPSPPQ